MSANRDPVLQPSVRKTHVVVGFVTLWAAAVFVYARWVNANRPGVVHPEGWYGWWDQSQYLKLVQILGEWRLPGSPVDYQYGLGYPVLAVPFDFLGFEGDPFAPVDLILFCVVIVGSYYLGRNLRTPLFGLVLALVVSVATPVLGLMVVPWNSSVGIAAFVSILAIATSANPITWQRATAIGVMVGFTFAARYVDGVVLAVLVVLVVAMRRRGDSWRLATASAISALLIVAAVLLSHSIVFGDPFTTPYAGHMREGLGSDQSLANYSLGWMPEHTVETFITAREDGARVAASPVLLTFLMLGLAPVGLIAMAVDDRRGRTAMRPNIRILVAVSALSVLSAAFYLSFASTSGGGLMFHSARYWQMWYPYWALLSLEAVWLLADWAGTPREPASVDDV